MGQASDFEGAGGIATWVSVLSGLGVRRTGSQVICTGFHSVVGDWISQDYSKGTECNTSSQIMILSSGRPRINKELYNMTYSQTCNIVQENI